MTTTRRGLFVAPFDALADPRLIGDLAVEAEQAGWDGFFLWDHLQYGDRVGAIADVWTCCAVVATRTERMLVGPMVTPLPAPEAAGAGAAGGQPGGAVGRPPRAGPRDRGRLGGRVRWVRQRDRPQGPWPDARRGARRPLRPAR